jgi:hypothetical protein
MRISILNEKKTPDRLIHRRIIYAIWYDKYIPLQSSNKKKRHASRQLILKLKLPTQVSPVKATIVTSADRSV